ncbi:MAG TPA: hypothetical protein ENN65_03210 [Candidatus Hydrogenedentes bacterium]|nr:hypothetical protein [Candidatus Hydrogenedentota bacterium]
MKIVQNARAIALRSYSMWAFYLGAALLFIPEIVYIASGADVDPRWRFLGLVLFIVGGALGRVIDQGMNKE